jgi:hypothetical protein
MNSGKKNPIITLVVTTMLVALLVAGVLYQTLIEDSPEPISSPVAATKSSDSTVTSTPLTVPRSAPPDSAPVVPLTPSVPTPSSPLPRPDDSSFYASGIQLTYDMLSGDIEPLEPVAYRSCKYEFEDGFEVAARCNVLTVTTFVLRADERRPEDRERFSQAVGALVETVKAYDARIISVSPSLGRMTIELQNDKEIYAIKADLEALHESVKVHFHIEDSAD